MLTGFEEKRENVGKDAEDVVLEHETWNADGEYVITIVVVIKEWCHEWRAYWRADATEPKGASEALSKLARMTRMALCRKDGNKIPHEVALAMVPFVEKQFDVVWRP